MKERKGGSSKDIKTGSSTDTAAGPKPKSAKSEKAKAKAQKTEQIELPNDGEYGGEVAGRKVWEALEEELKAWEKEHADAAPAAGSEKEGASTHSL